MAAATPNEPRRKWPIQQRLLGVVVVVVVGFLDEDEQVLNVKKRGCFWLGHMSKIKKKSLNKEEIVKLC